MNFLKIGILGKPHGLRGELRAEFYVDDLSDLDAFSAFYILDVKSSGGYRKLAISEVYVQSGRFIVRLEGVVDRTEAEKYRQIELWVDEAELPDLSDDEFYYRDLEQSKVFFDENVFGSVEAVLEIANRYQLLVLREDQKKLLVPIADRYFESFDKEHRQIKVRNIEELL